MNSLRVKFVRGDEVKYISHLDLMKVFERALRRSRLPIAYSQGFNPHPQMVFGLPMSVGVTSEAEYADFELAQDMKPSEFIEGLNRQLPKGFRIIDARPKKNASNIMASISASSYDIVAFLEHGTDIETFTSKVKSFMRKSEIMAQKETKKGIKDIDIRPLIYSLEIKPMIEGGAASGEPQEVFVLSTLLKAGSVANLKPELLVKAMNETVGTGIRFARIHRTGLFVTDKDILADPLDAGVL